MNIPNPDRFPRLNPVKLSRDVAAKDNINARAVLISFPERSLNFSENTALDSPRKSQKYKMKSIIFE